MNIKNIYIAVLLVICSVVFLGCGAKEPIVSSKLTGQEEISALSSDEAIGFILGRYHFYDGYSHVDTEKKRDDLETKLERCLKKSAGQRRPPIKVLSTETIKNHLDQDYGFNDFAKATPFELVGRLQAPGRSWDIINTGLRYLITIDINTYKSFHYEPYGDAEEGLMLLGLAKDGTKTTSIDVSVIDVKERAVVEEIDISSSGNQGWTAGVLMVYVLPVPYFFPWFSLTEAEVCNTFGEQIVELIAPHTDIEKTISQSKNGDVVLLEFRDGNTKKITVTHVDDRFVVGSYEYQLGHTTGVSYDRKSIKALKFLNASVKTPKETAKSIDMSQFLAGDPVAITFKNGDTKEVTITHIDARFVVGYVYYSLGQTAGVSYDRRLIKNIEHLK